jgi:hypothetical protein
MGHSSPESAADEENQQKQRQSLLSTIARRAAAVQRTLAAKHFRTLHALGSARSSMSEDQPPSRPGPDPIYAEIVGTTARIIDSKASQVLWRGEFWAARESRPSAVPVIGRRASPLGRCEANASVSAIEL